jgi:hypothetical protein
MEIACNLADPVESDLRVVDPPIAKAVPLTAGLTRPLWFYLIVLAWGLMGAEWWLYQRRKIA